MKELMRLHSEIKEVGVNGQISIGKEYAGKLVQIYKDEENTITIKTGKFIPENELWLYQGDNMEKLDKALEWAQNHTPSDNYEEIKKRILSDD